MLDDLFFRSLVAAIGVALAAVPLGCFVLWRRMAYFGDATAHAGILGVALAIGFSVSVFSGVLAIAVLMGVGVWALADRQVASDTILGVISYSALASGLLAVSMIDGVRVDLEAYLFGDILAVSLSDIGLIWVGSAIILIILGWRWSSMIVSTLGEDIATASGINPSREFLIQTMLLALVVAVAIKVVGALLIGAMLIIPAASARAIAKTPERMAILATGIAIGCAAVGLIAAFEIDTPAGPTIVVANSIAFIISTFLRRGSNEA